MARFAVLQPHLEGDVPLTRAAANAGVSLRTAQRWLTRYRRHGLAGLARLVRRDAGGHRAPADLVARIEGMGLKKPRFSAAAIHRRAVEIANAEGWPAPSYGTVHAVLARLDPAMVTLAHEGAAAFRDRYELIHRHRAAVPNAIWQADHTLLDLLVLDEGGMPVRPWLTVILDDHSRAVAGYMAFLGAPLGAPSVLNTCLALRKAIWRKADPAWPVCGIPDALYVDHGSDFTSNHLDQVAAALRFQVIYSAVGRPQGRGKIERLFGTLNTELLPVLPGHLVAGKPATAPGLSLAQLDREIGAFITGTYHARVHSEIGAAPLDAWRAGAFLPRLPDSLEDLDLLLVLPAKPRVVQRDGIRFQGLRYGSLTLAAYVGDPVTIRYDPRCTAGPWPGTPPTGFGSCCRCPPPRPETPSRSPRWRRPASRSDPPAAPAPAAIGAASRPGAASSPAPAGAAASYGGPSASPPGAPDPRRAVRSSSSRSCALRRACPPAARESV
jgi:putative transposase